MSVTKVGANFTALGGTELVYTSPLMLAVAWIQTLVPWFITQCAKHCPATPTP